MSLFIRALSAFCMAGSLLIAASLHRPDLMAIPLVVTYLIVSLFLPGSRRSEFSGLARDGRHPVAAGAGIAPGGTAAEVSRPRDTSAATYFSADQRGADTQMTRVGGDLLP